MTQKFILLSGLLLLNYQAFSGNPNALGAQVAQNTQNITLNTVAISRLRNQTAPAIGANLTTTEGGVVACTVASGGIRNLIATTTDDSTGVVWSSNVTIPIPAYSSIDGRNNTEVDYLSGATSGANRICYDLSTGGHDDWYLPGIAELNCLYQNRVAIGGFSTSPSSLYWSSTQNTYVSSNPIFAFFIDFTGPPPGLVGLAPTVEQFRVRCVRAFTP